MKIVDANVLLYATDKTSQNHRLAKQWVEQALVGTEPIGLAWVVLLAFLRISTNPRIYVHPLTPIQATKVVSTWLAQPATFVVGPTEHHIHTLASLLHLAGTGGNLVTDAHVAALALEHQAEVISFDSDFNRITGVRWSAPMPAPGADEPSN